MSLKAFHIVFIALSVLLAVGSAVYAVLAVEGALRWVWAVVALGAGAGLTVYGRVFLEKIRKLEGAG